MSYATQCGLDPAPLIRWLAESDHFFGVQIESDKFYLELEKLTNDELIQTLKIIQQVDFNLTGMELCLLKFTSASIRFLCLPFPQ
jgi:hypothetical protein